MKLKIICGFSSRWDQMALYENLENLSNPVPYVQNYAESFFKMKTQNMKIYEQSLLRLLILWSMKAFTNGEEPLNQTV